MHHRCINWQSSRHAARLSGIKSICLETSLVLTATEHARVSTHAQDITMNLNREKHKRWTKAQKLVEEHVLAAMAAKHAKMEVSLSPHFVSAALVWV